MGVVSSHQLSTFTTPVNGTSPIDANQVRGNDNAVKVQYNGHDADTTIHLQSGAVSARPAASTLGQTWLATDTSAVYLWLDTGATWVEANYLRSSGGTISGPVTISDTTQSTSTTTGALIVSGGVGIAKNVFVGGTLAVTGVATFTAQPILSSLTASAAVATDASKGLVSVTNTGTGNNVLSASPTLSGTIGGALTFSGAIAMGSTLNVTGAATLGNASSANTASYIVQRDVNGDFAGRNVTVASLASTTGGAVISATNNITTTAGDFVVSTASMGILNSSGTRAIAFGAGATPTVTFAGPVTGVSTLTTTGAINGQTISSAASFTGTLSVTSSASVGSLTATAGGVSATGVISTTNATNASSHNSGAIVASAGGLGIARDLWVGDASSNAFITINAATSLEAGIKWRNGGTAKWETYSAGGMWMIYNYTTGAQSFAVNGTTDAVILGTDPGGSQRLRVGGSGVLSGVLSVTDTTQSSSTSTGSAVLSGGLGVAKDIYGGGALTIAGIFNTTQTTNSFRINGNTIATLKGTKGVPAFGMQSGNTGSYFTIANGATADIGDMGIGFVFITNGNGYNAIFNVNGYGNATSIIYDSSSKYATTSTAGKISLYGSVPSTTFVLDNQSGVSVSFYVTWLG